MITSWAKLNMSLIEAIMREMEGGEQVVCQRWRNHRSEYRPSGEAIDIEGGGYHAKLIPKATAAEFVRTHHYSGSYVAARVNVGMIRDNAEGGQELCGVAGYSVPMSQAVIPKWLNCEPENGIDLGRFVLLDDVPANGETWFLKQSFKLLKEDKPEIQAVMATSDPLVRVNYLTGEIVMPGHVGTIYQAHNGAYLGRTTKKTVISGNDGNVITGRTLSKVRNQESGKDYSYQKLLAAGATEKQSSEQWRDYVRRATRELNRIQHPGNHVYAWPLGENKKENREIRQTIGAINPSDYPKEVEVY